jgi:EAL and modified HD-GYP domain-containing signal transduction protein
MALERAKFCELLAPLIKESAPRLYLLGVISLLDVILSIPMSQVVAMLPIDEEMRAALLGLKSPLAIPLKLIHSHETGDWQQYNDIRAVLGITDDAASTIYLESVRWAHGMNELNAGRRRR